MFKKLFMFSLTLILSMSGLILPVFAKEDISTFELPKPEAPHYMMYDAADRSATEGDDCLYIIRQSDMSVLALSTEESRDRDAFLEKYGLYDFRILMQYDTSLDNQNNWNYTSEWDKEYSVTPYEACADAWIGEDLIDKVTIFDLYECDPSNDNYSKLSDAIIRRDVHDGDYTFNNYYFDSENHSLYIRCRYYMEWQTDDGQTIGEKQSKYSEWSDVAVFGMNSTAVTPTAPTDYAAPQITNLKYIQPTGESELGQLTYELTTPKSVWDAAIYYEMTSDGYFDKLETEIRINGGEWLPYETVNSWSDWGLSAGIRTAFYEEPRIEADSDVQLRVRYVGSEGVSEWSNVISLKDGGTQEVTTPTDNPSVDKCSLCGFCPMPLGICLFIIIVIILAIIIIIVLFTRPKKCKQCGKKLSKKDKHCPKCGTQIK